MVKKFLMKLEEKSFYAIHMEELVWNRTVVLIGQQIWILLLSQQRAKKVLSDSLGLVDFAIGLVNFVFNLPDGQVMFYEEFE